MRKELVCPQCGCAVFWHIRQVPDSGAGHEHALAVSLRSPPKTAWWKVAPWSEANQPLAAGWFELLVCEGCSRVEWYGRAIDGANLKTEAFACPACGGTEAWRVPTLRERTGQLTAHVKVLPVLYGGFSEDGHYSLAVCTGCGFTEFSAREVQWVTEHRYGVTVDKTACRCGAPDRLRIAEAQEGRHDGIHPLHLSRVSNGWGERDVGRLAPTICRRCGATEWRALGIDELREDAARGVARIDGNARAVPVGGPYR